MSDEMRTRVGCGDGDTYITSDYHVGYQAATAAADAKYLPVIEKLVDRLQQSKAAIRATNSVDGFSLKLWAESEMAGVDEALALAATVMKGGK